jgi:nitrite reductase (NO-forming)
VALTGLAAAVAFLAAAVASLALPAATRLDLWLPLHLALAGGAATAIAAMVPFFVAALAVAPPASPILRGASVALVAVGGLLAAGGRFAGAQSIAAVGAWADVAGFAGVALSMAWSLRHAAGPRRPVTESAYLLALAEIAAGVILAGLYLAGDPGVTARWAVLKPAHGWLNAFGFVCLVIAGTLVHFAPTVAGARIRRRPMGGLAVAGLGVGPPVVAAGYALGAAIVVQAGALVTIVGAWALASHGFGAHRDRAGWTTEWSWHAFTAGSLLLAPLWLLVAAVTAGARVLTFGASPEGWRLPELLAPLVVGMVAQTLVGSLSFLVPAVGAGSPERHARQRGILGRAAPGRLLALNTGVALLAVWAWLGEPAGLGGSALAWSGAVLSLGAIAVTLALLARALSLRTPARSALRTPG